MSPRDADPFDRTCTVLLALALVLSVLGVAGGTLIVSGALRHLGL
jgi:hypothetical protein